MIKINATDIEKSLALRHADDFFITECKNGPSMYGNFLRMDAVAIKKAWSKPCITIYEVKISRNDFLRDDKWPLYMQYCNRFYFACPEGLIKKDELPNDVGLVYIKADGSVRTVKQVPARPVEPSAEFCQYILFNRLDGDRTPFYSKREEYIQAYLRHEISAQKLSYEFKSTLIRNAIEAEEEINNIKRKNEELISDSERYNKIIQVIRKYINFPSYWFDESLKRLEETLSNGIKDEKCGQLKGQLTEIANKILEIK